MIKDKKINIIYIIISVFIIIQVVTNYLIYPSFIKIIIKNSEKEANRTVNHIISSISESGYNFSDINIDEKYKSQILHITEHFSIEKLKIFDDNGLIIYSTNSVDIGEINDNLYFTDIVKSGKYFSKLVKKESKTLENKILSKDVLEIYVPIMKNNKFKAAVEVYYNVTDVVTVLNQKIIIFNILPTLIIILASISLFIIFYKLDKSILVQAKLKTELEEKNKILNNISKKDSLTGLLNHINFYEQLKLFYESRKKINMPLSIVMIDLDHFKEINDTHGHQIGDEVITCVSKILKETLRGHDFSSSMKDQNLNENLTGRYGGDEFVIILPVNNHDESKLIINRIYNKIKSINIKKELQITASIGIATFYNLNQYDEHKKLVALVDSILYQAKENGRDQIADHLFK